MGIALFMLTVCWVLGKCSILYAREFLRVSLVSRYSLLSEVRMFV